MIGKASRAKGVAGERESADIFRAAGFHVVTLQNNVRDHGDYMASMIGGRCFLVDAKRRERIRLIEWSRQVEGAVHRGEIPAVAYRPSREPWRVSMRLDDLAALVARHE